jgi:hypothetical protein
MTRPAQRPTPPVQTEPPPEPAPPAAEPAPLPTSLARGWRVALFLWGTSFAFLLAYEVLSATLKVLVRWFRG